MIGNPERHPRAGFTIVEILFATTIMTGVLLASFIAMQRDVQLQRSSLSVSIAESKAQSMLFKLERELSDARGANPRATLSSAVGATAEVTPNTLGFPDQGFLLIDRSNGSREIVAYSSLGGSTTFTGLTRGQQCTEQNNHAISGEVLWAGTAEPIPLQAGPPANLWDGQALEPTGTVFYQGLGTGFSYRVPTDPAGGANYLDGDDLQWGEVVAGTATLNGWGAVHFNPVWVFDEAAEGQDLNKDGDRTDLFDIGQIRRRTWDTANPGAPGTDIGLGPTVIVQERCNWGGDLDADGFNDPIFLWDANRRTLHVRLFVLGKADGAAAILRRVESMIFLRNEPGT